jgi:Arc/MetJ-type ribon-helix-helix transcriptional regulator
MSTLTVRLTEREELDLQLVCQQTGKSRSEVVRQLLAESLRGYRLRQALAASHELLAPAARQAGWLTEDDLLQDVA